MVEVTVDKTKHPSVASICEYLCTSTAVNEDWGDRPKFYQRPQQNRSVQPVVLTMIELDDPHRVGGMDFSHAGIVFILVDTELSPLCRAGLSVSEVTEDQEVCTGEHVEPGFRKSDSCSPRHWTLQC
jgi:hypothetical protein